MKPQTDQTHPTEIISGFSIDAREAIQTHPDYFVWWYTAKSIALCASLCTVAFLLGRSSARR